MDSEPNRCFALTKTKPFHRCSFKNQLEKNCIFCKKHELVKDVTRYDHNISKQNSNSLCINFNINSSKKKLKELCDLYNLDSNGNKKDLYTKLNKLRENINKYQQNYNHVLIIQKWYSKYKKIQINRLQNLQYRLNNIVNQEDFLSFEKIKDIDRKFLFYYKDDNTIYYVFDIRSLYQLLKSSNINPYTRKPFPNKIIESIKKIYTYLNSQNLIVREDIDKILTNEQKVKLLVIEIFIKIDSLDQYTDPEWFLELNLNKLHSFYRELEDIWNYRLSLTPVIKKKIIPPDGNLFILKPKQFNMIKNKEKAQYICLNIINKLISSAKNRSDRINGSIYVLFALVIVSKKAAEALPIYYNMVGNNIQPNSENYFLV